MSEPTREEIERAIDAWKDKKARAFPYIQDLVGAARAYLASLDAPPVPQEGASKTIYDVTVCDGKYRVLLDGEGFRALRYEDEWRNLTGDKLVLALVQEIAAIAPLLARIKELEDDLSEVEGMRDVALAANKALTDMGEREWTDTRQLAAEARIKELEQVIYDGRNQLHDAEAKISALEAKAKTLEGVETQLNELVLSLGGQRDAAEARVKELEELLDLSRGLLRHEGYCVLPSRINRALAAAEKPK